MPGSPVRPATTQAPAPRRPTQVTLSPSLLAEAQQLGIDLSRAAEMGIEAEVARRRQDTWLAQNAEALESSNAFVDAHGLPLGHHRNF